MRQDINDLEKTFMKNKNKFMSEINDNKTQKSKRLEETNNNYISYLDTLNKISIKNKNDKKTELESIRDNKLLNLQKDYDAVMKGIQIDFEKEEKLLNDKLENDKKKLYSNYEKSIELSSEKYNKAKSDNMDELLKIIKKQEEDLINKLK